MNMILRLRFPIFRISRQGMACQIRQNHNQFALMRDKAYINGKWVSAKSGNTFKVINPSTEEVLGEVPDCGVEDTEEAIKAAHDAFQSWGFTPAKERSQLLRKLFDLQMKHEEDIAKIITAEMGKTFREAKTEAVYGASFLEWFSEEARRIYGDVLQSPTNNKQMLVLKQPIGVAGLLTPWNFPNAMITRKAAAALATGCTCVIKPSSDTPYSALAVADLVERAGFPPGVFNVVTTSRKNSSKVGLTLCKSPSVGTISFTGSTDVGKILLEQCASTVKRVSLELGGNAPFIVFDSANIEKAVTGAMASKFRCSGQTCVCTNRILVQDSIHDKFVEKLAQAMVSELIVGDGFEPKSTIGPLINSGAVAKVKEHVQDAIDKGASVVVGGLSDSKGNFFQPTLMTNINTSMLASQEEVFGPVAPIMRFKTEEEAIAIANNTRVGLAGYFFSENISQIWRVAKRLEVGIIGINEGLTSCCEAAFGGVKESGLGREGSKYGIDEFVNIKYLCFGGLEN